MYNDTTNKAPLTVRITYAIDGTVQGVGFRPSVYRLAKSADLGGWIQNRSGSVQLCLEGTPEEIGKFIVFLHSHLPSQASIRYIKQLSKEKIDVADKSEFRIIESEPTANKDMLIPADLAICFACEKEIMDCENRRFGYPFTTCTLCGPRYTVIHDLPYDRKRTTMNQFPLCEECQKEYQNSDNRRFHAESIACSKCGPQLSLIENPGKKRNNNAVSDINGNNNQNVLREARAKLANGEIAAIRGIGGYLLAVDAFNEGAIRTLRQRKNRPAKPFAVMFRNTETVFKYCKFNSETVKLLMSSEAPIVILDLQETERSCFTEASQDRQRSATQSSIHNITAPQLHESTLLPIPLLSPDSHTIGAMIPYSPLHKLLFESIANDPTPPFDALVMTSGNRGGEPICITNDEAFERLKGVADFFLTHNREINLRCDDSLCALQLGKPQLWRRARGYAPTGINISNNGVKEKNLSTTGAARIAVLAMGAELKNTIAMGYGDKIVMSPHIGDLESSEAVAGMERVVECFPEFLGRKPEMIIMDLHPDMQSTRLGVKLASKLFPESGEADKRTLFVQHHHAHATACMGEHGLTKSLALVFDGTGLGSDGTIWGAECFAIDLSNEDQHRALISGTESKISVPQPVRLATFAGVPLPGGDAAVLHPVRQLVARYHNAGLSCEEICNKMRHYKSCSDKEIALWITQCAKGLNTPLSHAAGRLFDSVSIMLGIAPENVSYEGQSAIALEGAAKLANNPRHYKLKFLEKIEENMLIIDWKEIFANFAETDKVNEYAIAFHHAVAKSAVRMIEYANTKYPMKDVVLSGGVFMNRILTELVSAKLTQLGFNVYIHRKVPPNDGGIAFGQAIIGMRLLNQ